jgi:hypothetical protein
MSPRRALRARHSWPKCLRRLAPQVFPTHRETITRDLTTHAGALPKGATFVCANSLVVADKVVSSKTQYNLRVVETLVGARVLARLMHLPLDEDPALFAPGTSIVLLFPS